MFGGVASAAIFGSKDIILFNECYELPKYNNYKTYKNSTDNDFDEWSLEINLKKNNFLSPIFIIPICLELILKKK